MAAPKSTVQSSDVKLPFLVVLGWGLGSLGVLTILHVTNSLVLKYVVDIMGISAAIAGAIIGAMRLFDALLDPFMGTVSDATNTRWGRRRPYLLLGGIMCALSPIIIFAAPKLLTPSSALVYLVVALMFYAIAYTVFNVPYMAMPVEMTQDHHERTYLFTFRVYGSALSILIGGGLAPALVDLFGGGRDGFTSMALVMGALVLCFCFASFYLTGAAPATLQTDKDRRPKLTQLRGVFRNKPFVALMFIKIFLVAGLGLGSSAMAFFVTIVMDRPLSWLGFISGGFTVGMIASQVIWLRISKHLGKRRCFLIAAGLYVAALLTWLLAGPNEILAITLIRSVVIGIFAGGVFLASQAMLPDTLEHELKISGVRHEGVMTGVYTTIERGSSALGVALAGVVLSAGGYVAGAAAAEQPASAIIAIYLTVGAIPAIALIFSAIAASKYDLPG